MSPASSLPPSMTSFPDFALKAQVLPSAAMFASNSKLSLLAVAALAASSVVEAHSNMILPLPTWNDTFYGRNSPSATIDGPTALTVPSGMSFSTSPSANTEAYTAAFKASKYKSLRELVYATEVLSDGASAQCGFSKLGAAQPLPDKVEWNQLTSSHEGPCEVWCDDVLAFSDTDCAAHFTTTPALLPYDKSKCTGAGVLQSIWLALHTPTWQVYTNCAALSGGSSSTTKTSTAASASSATEASASSAPEASASSTAAEASASSEYDTPATTTTTTTAPATTTAAPAATTATPAATSVESDGSSKCNVRRRRN